MPSNFQPFSIDEGVLSEPRRPAVQVPEGDYLGVIRGIYVPPEDADAVNYYRFDVELTDGHALGIGKRVPFRTTMQDAAPGKRSPQFGIGNLLTATNNRPFVEELYTVGQQAREAGRPMISTYPKFKQLGETIYEKVKDIPVCVSVGDHSYNGTMYSEVKSVLPAEMYEPPRDMAPRTANGAPSANAVGADAASDNAFINETDKVFTPGATV